MKKSTIVDIAVITANGLLNVVYAGMKLLPVQNKIVYLSRQQNTVPLDFSLIAEEMKKSHPEYRNVMLVKMVPDSVQGKVGYCFYFVKQMYHIATAKAAVLDTYSLPICMLKQRDSLKVIQIWHALGAFKRFSLSILDQEEGRSSRMAKLMHMHENYTDVLTSSSFCLPFFQEAFGAREDQMRVIPLPRVDYICDPENREQTRERIFRRYPQLRNTNKKILVYAPTFRKYEADLGRAAEAIADRLDPSKYQLIVKLHPLSGAEIHRTDIIADGSFATHEIFQVADAVIADYSAVIFEAALLDLPLYFYAFDKEQYVRKRDFYIDYEKDMPGPICLTAEDLVWQIEHETCDTGSVKAFCDRMVERDGRSSAEKIVELMGIS